MNQKNERQDVWYIDICSTNASFENISRLFRDRSIHLQPWHRSLAASFGLILMDGNDSYEQLISILNIQVKHQHNRIVVWNLSKSKLSNEAVFKILKYGAEYFFESTSIEEVSEYIGEKFLRWRNIEIILKAPAIAKNIIGESKAMKKLLRNIIEAGVYSDVSILIQGERGTGKESIAHLIHDLDRRRANSNIVLVDCTTIRPELSGSEFFGHEKGSYTGADTTRDGAFSLANNGTLFLDEVGEIPLPMQAELLRIIQEGTYKKLGSNIWKQTNFRLVCATNRHLLSECEHGHFRKDLYDRISLWNCYMPALSERKEDVPLLVNHFLQKKFPVATPVVEDRVIDYLCNRDYPGNIRELQNLINRIGLKYIGKGPITMGDIPDTDLSLQGLSSESWYESKVFRDKITEALQSGNDAKNIMDTIKSLVTKIALASADNNKEVSQLLGKSERWIQLQKAKEK